MKYQSMTLHEKTIILPLKEQAHIAVIEPESKSNKAYILSDSGSIKWDVSEIAKTTYPNPLNAYFHFLDVYYIQDELYFFINTGEAYDYRFSFSPITGEIGELISSY